MNVKLTWSAPASTSSLADCQAADPHLETDAGNLVSTCSDWRVALNGDWQALSEGGCQSDAHYGQFSGCPVVHGPPSDAGTWAQTINTLRVLTPDGTLLQANNDSYVFMLR